MMQNCYTNTFNEENQMDEDLVNEKGEVIDAEWAKFFNEDNDFTKNFKTRLSQGAEYFIGNFGQYYPHSGYQQYFYPYD